MALQQNYRKTDKRGKTEILNEYVKNTGHNRKYVISQLNKRDLLKQSSKKRKARKCLYDDSILSNLEKLYVIFDCPCGQRLKPIIEQELDRLINFGEIEASTPEIALLKDISTATIDRKIKKIRDKHRAKGISVTKPGSLLKKQIPIRLTEWDTSNIGYWEIDLVAHCGTNASGVFASTLSMTEIASGWWEGECLANKGQLSALEGIKNIRNRTNFSWKGIDSDNGSEFINHHLFNYCKSEQLDFTRSRPNHKNDNAYIEQKNWTHVRKVLGYSRFDSPEEISLINSLYRNELRLYKNFFQPSMKLKAKNRGGDKPKRQYEKAQTPFYRLIHSNQIDSENKQKLRSSYEKLNPADLKRKIDKKLYQLYLINQQKSWDLPGPLRLYKNNIKRSEVLV